MEDDIKVSVIVVTYNQEDSISAALESILQQKCDFKYEIIIGEDCSEDSTRAICREYSRKYPSIIRLIENDYNKGLRDNYYDCLLKARGKYIADLAGDDVWVAEDKLQLQADVLDSDENIVLVHTNWQYKDIKSGDITSAWGKSGYPYPRLANKDEIIPILLSSSHVIHSCTAMFRNKDFKAVYDNYRDAFRNSTFIVEDIQLFTLLATRGKVLFIDKICLHYSINGSGLTSETSKEKTFDTYFSTLKLYNYLSTLMNVDSAVLDVRNRKQYHYILMLAFYLCDSVRRNMIKNAGNELKISPSLKSRIALMLSSNAILWKVSRYLINKIR